MNSLNLNWSKYPGVLEGCVGKMMMVILQVEVGMEGQYKQEAPLVAFLCMPRLYPPPMQSCL